MLDLARAGWLWCNYGRWGDAQLVPETWMHDSTQVAPHIKAHCSEKDWLYGNGFWSNSEGMIWPRLPRDGFIRGVPAAITPPCSPARNW